MRLRIRLWITIFIASFLAAWLVSAGITDGDALKIVGGVFCAITALVLILAEGSYYGT